LPFSLWLQTQSLQDLPFSLWLQTQSLQIHGLAFEEPVGSAGGSNAVAENTLNPIGTGLQTRENRDDPDGFLEAIWIGLESELPH
jgi:hypothetical protein